MKTKLLIALAAFVLFSSASQASEKNTESLVKEVLIGPQMGQWQVISIPKEWQTKNWKNSNFQSLYIALRGPHYNDLANYSPCNAPSRLLLGTEDNDGVRNEHLLTCLHYCSPSDSAEKVYRDLWARNTDLDGITAQLLVNGNIEVLEHFIRNLGIDRKSLQDINVVQKNHFGKEKRIRSHIFTVKDIKQAVRQKGEASCMERAANPPF